ncbi:MAG: hypothetical protein PHI22_04320, partial [Bacilli bacterium]|nr:hypothetical protein [Bacilli bacterium]
GIKSVVPIYEKSTLDRRHPIFSTIINMAIMFAPSFILAFIISSIFGDLTYLVHNAIMINWLYRVIKYFNNKKKIMKSFNNLKTADLLDNSQISSSKIDIDKLSSEELLALVNDKNSLYYLDRRVPENMILLKKIEEQESFRKDLIELQKKYQGQHESKTDEQKVNNNEAENAIRKLYNDDTESESDKSILEYLKIREKDLLFTAASLTYGFKKIKNDLNVSNGKAIFGSLFISQKTWLESGILDLNNIVEMLTDARSSTCTLDNYWDVHGYGTPFSNEIEFLTNLSMADSCKGISINKPEIEHEQIIDFVINHKEIIKEVVQNAMSDNYDLGMMRSILDINTNNGIKQYEKLIRGFKEEGIQPK